MATSRVRADYEQLKRIAQTFSQQATAIRQTFQNLKRQKEILENDQWLGQNASTFYQEMNATVLPSLNRLTTALEAAQKSTQQISQVIKRAEEDAAIVLRGQGGGGNSSESNSKAPGLAMPAHSGTPPTPTQTPTSPSTQTPTATPTQTPTPSATPTSTSTPSAASTPAATTTPAPTSMPGLALAQMWFWYHQNVNQRLYDIPTVRENNWKMTGIILDHYRSQLWAKTFQPYIQLIPALQLIWEKKLHAVQSPGLPADDALTPGLKVMAELDAAGNPISPVGAEVARLVDKRSGVAVTFADGLTAGGRAGVAPLPGQIWLPNSYLGDGQAADAGRVGLMAHELTHVFERDLNDPTYWPNGNLRLSVNGQRWVADATNHMEVLSYMVGEAVEYDRLQNQLPTLPVGDAQIPVIQGRLKDIETNLGLVKE